MAPKRAEPKRARAASARAHPRVDAVPEHTRNASATGVRSDGRPSSGPLQPCPSGCGFAIGSRSSTTHCCSHCSRRPNTHGAGCLQNRADVKTFDVLVSGRIFVGASWTGVESDFAERMAINRHDGLICFVGSQEELDLALEMGSLRRAEWCRVYSIPGLVMPAFHDAHCHPFGAGNRLRQYSKSIEAEDKQFRSKAINLETCTSWEDVSAALRLALDESLDDGIIFAENCNLEICEPLKIDIAARLQEVVSDRLAVVLLGNPAEAVAVNETALRVLPERCKAWQYLPTDRRIHRKAGRPTGHFLGAIWAHRFALLSPASISSQGLRGLWDGLVELPKQGIVSCIDAFVLEDRVPLFEAAYFDDKTSQLPRTSLSIGFRETYTLREVNGVIERAAATRRTWESTRFRYCLREGKVEVDKYGSWSSSSPDSGSTWDLNVLQRVVEGMLQADFSMHFHVFGDLAAKHSLNLLRSACVADMPRGGRARRPPDTKRHKLAHVFELLPEEIEALGRTHKNVYVVYQPLWYAQGTEHKVDQALQQNQLLANGASVCWGSDWDITPLCPLKGINAALQQQVPVFDEKLPWKHRLACALRLYMIDSASAMWLEKHTGTLETGKFADFCILEKDIFEMTEDDFREAHPKLGELRKKPFPVPILATFGRGVCLFRKENELVFSMISVFSKLDKNGDGLICKDELCAVLLQLDSEAWTEEKVMAIMEAADLNKDERIDFKEFVKWVTDDVEGKTTFENWAGAPAFEDDFLCGTCACTPMPWKCC